MAPIQSRLWKAAELALRSTYFPTMVQAACWVQDKPYSEALLREVATTPGIVNALTVEPNQSIDVPLVNAMITNGSALDGAIMTAVSAYTAPS